MAKRNLMNDLIWRKNSFNTHIYLCTDLCFAAPFFDGFSMSGQHAKIEKGQKDLLEVVKIMVIYFDHMYKLPTLFHVFN